MSGGHIAQQMEKSLPYRLVLVIFLLLAGCLQGCREAYTPRPYGYYRVTIPPHSYVKTVTGSLPFAFEASSLGVISMRGEIEGGYWFDIHYPLLSADIHCSYRQIEGDLQVLSEDARRFVYSHSGQAEGISEHFFEDAARRVYGLLYDLKGNVASPVQFVLTDSTRHFFRGALYFQHVPNKDSIAPMLDYVREDIVFLMENFEWLD